MNSRPLFLALSLLSALAASAANPTATNTAPARSLAPLDTDHDGRINLEEFYRSGPAPLHPRMKRVFDSIDTDQSGSLTYADTERVIAKVRGLMPKTNPEASGAFQPIPLEVSPESRRAVIKATVNGVEGRFLLDTGTSDTIVDTEFARAAGVDFVEICTHIVAGNYGQKGDLICLVRVPDMEIGGTHFKDFHAVMREDAKPRRDFSGRLAGIIGANILFAHPLTLDIRRANISFPTNTAATGPHDFSFPLLPDRQKTAAVNAEIDGAPVILMFDSGASIGDTILVNQHYHEALRKQAGDATAKEYHAKEVTVAGRSLLTDQRCRLLPFEESVLGSYFFDRHVITVDQSAHRVWLDRNR